LKLIDNDGLKHL